MTNPSRSTLIRSIYVITSEMCCVLALVGAGVLSWGNSVAAKDESEPYLTSPLATGSITANANPIQVCDGTGLGITTLSWTSSGTTAVEVHLDEPSGMLLASTGPSGSITTGKWVGQGTQFFLQDVSAGPHTWDNTLATVTVSLTTAGCSSPGAQWANNGTNINNANTGNVGVGTPTPASILTVQTTGLDSAGEKYLRVKNTNSYAGMLLDPGQAGDAGWLVMGGYPNAGDFTVRQFSFANHLTIKKNTGYVGFGTSNPQSNLQIGSQAGSSTASPVSLSLGGTFSNIAGANLKLKLYDDTVTANTYGIGVSAGSMDFGVSPSAGYNWYAGGTHRMKLDSAGNIGLGTTTPNFRFDVQGGQINASGGLCIAGVCKTAWSQVGGGGSSQWTTSGTNVFYDSGNVGIGTASPLRTLDLGTSGQLTFGNNGYSSTGSPGLFWYSDNINYGIYKSAGSWSPPNYQQLTLNFPTGIVIDGGSAYGKSGTVLQPNGGNVGIGTTAPTSLLTTSQAPLNDATNRVGNYLFMESRNSTGSNIANTHTVLSVEGSTNNGYTWSGQTGVKSTVGPNWGGITDAVAFYANGRTQLNYHSISNLYNFFAASPTVVPNSFISNSFGLYLANQKAANVTNGYGVYQAGAGDLNYFAGNVGIGTPAPSFRLDVQGGQINASGGLCIAGLCKTSWSEVGGAGGSQWTTSGSNVFYSAGNVGIGASAPAAKLSVGGNGVNYYATDAWIENNMHVQGNEALGQGGRGRLRIGSAWGYSGLYADASSTGAANDLILGATSGTVRVGPGGTPQNLIVPTGNVGIGTSAPGFRLQIDGASGAGIFGSGGNTIADGLNIRTGNTINGVQLMHGSATAFMALNPDALGSGALGIGTKGNFPVYFYANSGLTAGSPATTGIRMAILGSGNVGIGTTTPGFKLDVNGEINATGFRINNVPISTGGTGAVSSVFGRTGAVVQQNGDYTWQQITKSGSSLGDIENRSAGLLTGTVPKERLGDSGIRDATTFLRGDNTWATVTGGSSQWASAPGAGGSTNISYSGGNVGIGTTTPAVPLDLKGNNVAWGGQLRLQAPDFAQITFYNQNNPALAQANRAASISYDMGNTALFIDSSIGSKRLLLQALGGGGNVGIGTTAPAFKLDVAGDIRANALRFPDGSFLTTAPSGGGTGGGTITGVTAGAGLMGGGTSGAVTLTNSDPGSGQAIFKHVAGASGPPIISAASNSDILRFVGTGGTNVSFDPGNKKVIIDSSGSGGGGATAFGSITAGTNTTQLLVGPGGSLVSSGGTIDATKLNGATFAAPGAIGTITPGPGTFSSISGPNPGPNAILQVNGSINVSGNINAKYQDVAEWVESSQELLAGTLVVLDHTKSNQVIASSQAYDTRVAGVISAQPGITLGEGGDNKVLVATTGRVRLIVDASKGPIQIGDLLVTSDIPGVAMKSQAINVGGVQIHRPGTLVGKALEPLAKGQAKILVLLSLQ